MFESPIDGSNVPNRTPDAAALSVTPLGHSLVKYSKGNAQDINCIATSKDGQKVHNKDEGINH